MRERRRCSEYGTYGGMIGGMQRLSRLALVELSSRPRFCREVLLVQSAAGVQSYWGSLPASPLPQGVSTTTWQRLEQAFMIGIGSVSPLAQLLPVYAIAKHTARCTTAVWEGARMDTNTTSWLLMQTAPVHWIGIAASTPGSLTSLD